MDFTKRIFCVISILYILCVIYYSFSCRNSEGIRVDDFDSISSGAFSVRGGHGDRRYYGSSLSAWNNRCSGSGDRNYCSLRRRLASCMIKGGIHNEATDKESLRKSHRG